MGRPPPDEDSGVLLESLGSSGSSASSGSSGFEDASQQEEQDSEEVEEEVEDNGSVLSDSEEERQIKKMYDEWPDSEEEEARRQAGPLEPKYTVFLPGAEEEEETQEQRNERHHKMLRYQEIVSAVDGKIDIKIIRDLGIGTTIRRTVREGDMAILTRNEYEFTIPPADEEVDNRFGSMTNGRSKQQIQYFYGMKILALQKKEPNSAEELETYLDARYDKDTGRGCLKATHFLQLISMYTDPEAPDHIFKKKAYVKILGLTMWNEHSTQHCMKFPGTFPLEILEQCRRSFLETTLSSSEFVISYDIEYDIQVASNWSTPENCNWGELTRWWKDLVVKHLEVARIALENAIRNPTFEVTMGDVEKKLLKQARARRKAAKEKQDADDKEKLRKDVSASMESRMKRAKEKKEKEENDALLAELYQQEREDKERQEQTEKSRAGAKRKADAIQPTMDTGKKKEPRKSNYDPNKPKPNKTCAQHPKDANMCSLVPVENLCKFCMKAKRKAAKK